MRFNVCILLMGLLIICKYDLTWFCIGIGLIMVPYMFQVPYGHHHILWAKKGNGRWRFSIIGDFRFNTTRKVVGSPDVHAMLSLRFKYCPDISPYSILLIDFALSYHGPDQLTCSTCHAVLWYADIPIKLEQVFQESYDICCKGYITYIIMCSSVWQINYIWLRPTET